MQIMVRLFISNSSLMATHRFLIQITGIVLTLACIHVGLFIYQLGAPIQAEYWLYESAIVKHHLASHTSSPKVLVLGGSSSLFGIDSQRIQSEIGLPTINLALHAGFSFNHAFREAQQFLQPHDHVILGIEYYRYASNRSYDRWFTNQVMTWNTDYFWRLSWFQRAIFIRSVTWHRLAAGALTQVFQARSLAFTRRKLAAPEEILAEHEQAQHETSLAPRYLYSSRNINFSGDIRFSRRAPELGDTDYGLALPFESFDEVWDEFRAFAAYCRNKDITVWVIWPPTMKSAALNFGNPAVQAHIQKLSQELRLLHWTILGSPVDFQYEKTLFADTADHLMPEGRRVRTEKILQEIRLSSRTFPSATLR